VHEELELVKKKIVVLLATGSFRDLRACFFMASLAFKSFSSEVSFLALPKINLNGIKSFFFFQRSLWSEPTGEAIPNRP
jgi:hypothetical protein